MITNKDIDNGRSFDWGRTSKDYGKYRDIYPKEFYKRIVELGLCTNGQNVLDVGTGTGVLPRNLYQFGAKFTGIDISENQIKEAIMLSVDQNMNIDYIVSSAENISFAPKTFDVVTACQCFMYFDNETAISKIHTVLKDDGHFCVLFLMWLPYESEIAKTSENIVLKYNPEWTGAGMQRFDVVPSDATKRYFEVENALAFDLNLEFTRESWHGRMKACRGVGASSLSESEIAMWEKEHMTYMKTLPETFDIIHYATILNLRKRML